MMQHGWHSFYALLCLFLAKLACLVQTDVASCSLLQLTNDMPKLCGPKLQRGWPPLHAVHAYFMSEIVNNDVVIYVLLCWI